MVPKPEQRQWALLARPGLRVSMLHSLRPVNLSPQDHRRVLLQAPRFRPSHGRRPCAFGALGMSMFCKCNNYFVAGTIILFRICEGMINLLICYTVNI